MTIKEEVYQEMAKKDNIMFTEVIDLTLKKVEELIDEYPNEFILEADTSEYVKTVKEELKQKLRGGE